MFTGIISSIGVIEASEQQGDLRIKIASDYKAEALQTGESIACNGVCLTILTKGLLSSGKSYFTASLSAETIARTVSGQWEKGAKVNLERALKLGDTLDGHMVSGHVDGIAEIAEITPVGDSHMLKIQIAPELCRFIAAKGSVTLDGISLTVNSVEGNFFCVNIIPHTWSATTLGEHFEGDSVNVEVDMIARYLDRLIQK